MEIDRHFLDVLVKPDINEYMETLIYVRGKPFLVKILVVETRNIFIY